MIHEGSDVDLGRASISANLKGLWQMLACSSLVVFPERFKIKMMVCDKCFFSQAA
jgi:hypothetical protein